MVYLSGNTQRQILLFFSNSCIIIFTIAFWMEGVSAMKTYCERLRELREKRGLKQSDIAQILETTQQVYSRYENGVNALPIHHLITLCKFYRISADYVLGLHADDDK